MGFTMVELMAVVTIVGILATIATVAYRKYIKSSKTTEAQSGLADMKIAHASYYSDQLTYLNVSPDLSASGSFHPPNSTPGKSKMNWGTTSSTKANWDRLGYVMEGATYFVYASTAGTAGTAPTAIGSDITIGNWPSSTPGPWFIVKAKADLDSQGTTVFVMTSFSGDTFSVNN